MPNEEIRILPDLETVSQAAARMFTSAAEVSITMKGIFSVAISGGATPARSYEILGSPAFTGRVAWPKVHIFWADERCVRPENEESNFYLARRTLLSRVDLPPDNIHRVRGEEGSRKGALLYEEEMKRFFGAKRVPVFDLIILGLGKDGHTASLFPGSSALRAGRRLAAPAQGGEGGLERVTLTLPVINNASRVIFLVSGPQKAGIVKEILGGSGRREQYPAGLVRIRNGSLTWLIDEAASAGLQKQPSPSLAGRFPTRP